MEARRLVSNPACTSPHCAVSREGDRAREALRVTSRLLKSDRFQQKIGHHFAESLE